MRKIYLIAVVFTMLFPAAVFAQDMDDEAQGNVPFEWNFGKYRFGGYGEVLFQHMTYGTNRYTNPVGATKDKRSEISLPRAVFSFDYKFRDDIVLGTEIEFEYGGTGVAKEVEYNKEGGEFETEIEKGGEVVLEQLHITKRFSRALNVRIGHMIVPVGLTNAHHEPTLFFGTVRPESETSLLPSTWHETGIALLGYIGDFRYEAMVVNGLDPNGFSSENWVGSGRQKVFEKVKMTDPAFALRVDYFGVKNLRVGMSGYIGNTAKNSSKPYAMSGVKGTVKIGSFDAQYIGYNVIARANFIYGNVSHSKEIYDINRKYFKGTGYSITPFGEAAMAYGAEAGYNVLSFFETKEKLYPFVRYEYYNTGEKIADGATALPRYKRDILTVGFNYFLSNSLVLKADYSYRRIGGSTYNSEDTFGITLAYSGWFISK